MTKKEQDYEAIQRTRYYLFNLQIDIEQCNLRIAAYVDTMRIMEKKLATLESKYGITHDNSQLTKQL